MEIGNFRKLEIGRRILNSCPPARGALLGAINCPVVFQTPFYPFNRSLNFLKFHFNSCLPPPQATAALINNEIFISIKEKV